LDRAHPRRARTAFRPSLARVRLACQLKADTTLDDGADDTVADPATPRTAPRVRLSRGGSRTSAGGSLAGNVCSSGSLIGSRAAASVSLPHPVLRSRCRFSPSFISVRRARVLSCPSADVLLQGFGFVLYFPEPILHNIERVDDAAKPVRLEDRDMTNTIGVHQLVDRR